MHHFIISYFIKVLSYFRIVYYRLLYYYNNIIININSYSIFTHSLLLPPKYTF